MSGAEPASRRLGDIVTLEKGFPPVQRSYFGPGAEPYLTPEYLRGGSFAELVKPSSRAVRVNNGDTIVLWDGSNAGEVMRGRSGVLASTMMRVLHEAQFEAGYLFYALKRWEPFLRGQTSGSGIPHIDKEIFRNLSIIEFPPEEQTAIAKILSTIDEAIDNTKTLIAKQRRISAGLMQDLLRRGIDENGNLRSERTHEFKDSPLGRVPTEHEILTFEQTTPKDAPIGYGIVQPGPYDHSGVRVAGIYTINSNFQRWHMSSVRIERAYVRSRIQPSDVLLSIKGTTGRVGVVPQGVHGNISREIARIRPLPRINPHYLRFLLLSDFLQRHLLKAEVGTTRAELSIASLRELPITIPPRAEQDVVAAKLSTLERQAEATQKSLAKHLAIGAGLMRDLLTGSQRVTALLPNLSSPVT
jgi:type I restriction enzyme, S subunit